ncbi:MAG: type VII toxin-antitoxin system HepT family RNase toxin [Candidatus Thorarchaeota archaeon]
MDQRIIIKLDEQEQILSELKDILPQNQQAYLNAPIVRRAVERLIQISIELVIDICAKLIKELRLGVPKSEDDMFSKLEKTVFSPALINILRKMKSFRNKVVHRYGELNDELVYQIVQNIFSDFALFAKELRTFLKTR